ncbi:hypothetical protein BT96DRAFT_783963, partial [Gymnopus androsaceus JB14]
QAGPSGLQSSTNLMEPFIHEDFGDDEQEDTPKLPTFSALPAEISSAFPEDTPAARLKAVLERTSAKSKPPPAASAPSDSVAESESDFDMPNFGSSQPSLARVTLDSLFTHALRDAGDTPQKSGKGKMKRRNSIDTSEFESSPRVVKVKKDRTDYKGKRRSMSDDELSCSNSALYFILLNILISLYSSLSRSLSSCTNESLDTVKLLKDLNSSQFEPPAATSTPQHSLKMSVNSQFQTNLMDQDSEMQQAMRDLDSYENSL